MNKRVYCKMKCGLGLQQYREITIDQRIPNTMYIAFKMIGGNENLQLVADNTVIFSPYLG